MSTGSNSRTGRHNSTRQKTGPLRIRKTKRERKDEILKATIEEIRVLGLAGFQMADVRHRLGLSVGAVHYHFDSRDTLIAAAYERFAQLSAERLKEQVEGTDDALQKMRHIVAAYLPQPEGDEWLLWVEAWAAALHCEQIADTLQSQSEVWREVIEEVLAHGQAAGVFRVQDLEGAARRIMSLLHGFGTQLATGLFKDRAAVRSWIEDGIARELELDQPFSLN